MTPFWISAFLDVPATDHARAADFWSAVTAMSPSEPRGDHGEYTTLVPEEGDGFLRMQRVGDGPARLHLDLHVEEPRAAADAAVARGAREVVDLGYVVLTSPGGLPFCFVGHLAGRRPPARTWTSGQSSLVDQVCLDIAPAAYDEELAFWAATTGFPLDAHQRHPEFRLLEGPDDQPLQLLVQRLDDGDGPTTAHFDLGTSDGGRSAEVARHEALGATVLREHEHWTVLTDPAGMTYCITDHPVR
ncbi:MAG: VOC family protein [Nocardioides sp.]|nr:VOC family protein [Nocardioides sp.]